MGSKPFFCLPVRRNLFLKTQSYFRFNFSILAESNVSNSNAPSQNLFLHFVTTRFNISSADAAKMLKSVPSLGRLKTLDKVEQLASMLNRHGCTEDQIAKMIRLQPSLIYISAERLLEPKIQVLKDLGMEKENITNIVTRCPRILTSKLENLCSNLELLKTVFPTRDILIKFVTTFPRIFGTNLETLRSNFELLKTVFPTQDLLIRAITNNPHILRRSLHKDFKSSIAFWEDFGFRGIELTKFAVSNTWVLMRSSLTPEQLDLIRKIGIQKESKMYKYIVSIVARSRVEVLEAKIDNLQLCGLSPEEAWELIRVDPSVLYKSEESIKKKMDFMLNEMGLSVDFVTKHPRMFSMSVDKVMRPRFLVLRSMTALNGAGEVNPTRLCTILTMTEGKFVAQIIQGHPESAALWTVYKNALLMSQKAQR